MKRKRILLCILCSVLLLFSMSVLSVNAHPGGTDSNGGHRDRTTGEYHYHHGYEAHDHYDVDGDGVIDCPFDFDDQTGESSGISPFSGIKSNRIINFTLPSVSEPTNGDKPRATDPTTQSDNQLNSTSRNISLSIGRIYFAFSLISIFVMIFLYHLFDYLKPRSEKYSKLILNIWSAVGIVFLLSTVLVVFPYAKWFDKKKAKISQNKIPTWSNNKE